MELSIIKFLYKNNTFEISISEFEKIHTGNIEIENAKTGNKEVFNFLEENENKKMFVNNKGIKLIIHRT